MDAEEMKKLLKAVDENETRFAEQKAQYEARREALFATLCRIGQEMVA